MTVMTRSTPAVTGTIGQETGRKPVLYSAATAVGGLARSPGRAWREASAMEYAFLTGLGLAAPAGLNAYLPLLIVALADRFTETIELDRPYDFLSSTWGIAILLLLVSVEVIVDKIAGADHLNDLIQSIIRPAAGAFLMMASNSDGGSLNPVLAMLIGLVVAGSVHAAKATARPAVTVTTGGVGNPLVSMVEDAIAVITSIVALLAPILIPLLLAFFAVAVWWSVRRLKRLAARVGPTRRPPGPTQEPAPTTLRR
jgi:hypothetical protein